MINWERVLINTTMNNEQLLQNILDVTPFACVLMADTLEIKYMNPIMSEFFSLNSEKSMTGASFFSYLSEEEQESFLTFIQSLGESEAALLVVVQGRPRFFICPFVTYPDTLTQS